MNRELRDRVVLPVAIPVGIMVVIAAFVFAFSRVLLAVGKDMAVLVAIAAAVDILVVCTIVALRPPTPATYRLAALAAVGVIVAGGLAMRGAAPAQEVAEEAPAVAGAEPVGEVGGAAIRLTAKDLTFGTKSLSAAVGEVTLELRNEDPSTPHNFALYRDASQAENLFKGELFNGVSTKTYTFRSPPAGSYYFQCDVHPTTMSGTLTVR